MQQINKRQDICVKISSSDFLDSKNRRILNWYKEIDYSSFDTIIFLTRKNIVDAILSFTYMDPKDHTTWHRQLGQHKVYKKYTAALDRAHYLIRSYRVFKLVKDFIVSNYKNQNFYEYEFDDVEEKISNDFSLLLDDFKISLVDNDIDYKLLVENYTALENVIKDLHNVIALSTDEDLNSQQSAFWLYHPYFI